MEEIENEIIDLKEKIQKYEENLAVDTSINLYVGTAFIVFQKPTHAHAVLNSQDDSLLLYTLKLLWRNFCCCFVSKNSASNFQFAKAPEPSDVYWENMNITFIRRFKVTLVTYLGTSLVIGVCLLLTWGFSELKDEMNQRIEDAEEDGDGVSRGEWVGIRIVTTISSLVVVITNKALLIVVRKLSLKERHLTLTNYNLSVATKLTAARFINSALVPIIVNWSIEEWFG